MLDLAEINAAATRAVKCALDGAGIQSEMLAKEVYENIPRPSAKIIFGETKVTRNGLDTWERTCELIAVWNAPNVVTFKLDCLAAQQAVELYLLREGLCVPCKRHLPVLEVKSSIENAAVIMRFSVTDYGTIDGETDGEDGEIMEDLYTSMGEN